MYTETLRSTSKDNKGPALFTFLLLVGLIFATMLGNFLYSKLHTPFVTYLVFAVYVVSGVYVYRYRITEYRYSLGEDCIIFTRCVGKREMPILSVHFKDIVYFTPLVEEKEYKREISKNVYALYSRKSPKAYTITAKYDEDIYRVVFEPSNTLAGMIKERM